jgi:hypothetical protein
VGGLLSFIKMSDTDTDEQIEVARTLKVAGHAFLVTSLLPMALVVYQLIEEYRFKQLQKVLDIQHDRYVDKHNQYKGSNNGSGSSGSSGYNLFTQPATTAATTRGTANGPASATTTAIVNGGDDNGQGNGQGNGNGQDYGQGFEMGSSSSTSSLSLSTSSSNHYTNHTNGNYNNGNYNNTNDHGIHNDYGSNSNRVTEQTHLLAWASGSSSSRSGSGDEADQHHDNKV